MARLVAFALVLTLAVLAVAPVPTEAAPADRARLRVILNRLDSTLVNVNFDETPLDEALKFISRFSGVNLIIAPKLRQDIPPEDLTLTLKLTGVSARQALRIMLEYKDLGIVFRNGVLQVTTKEDARGKPVLRIYSIADLTFQLRDFPGPDLQLRPAGYEFTEEELPEREDPFEDPEFIADLVRSNIEPDSWESEGVSIQAHKKMLIVRQSPAIHAKIARLLALLRAAK